MLTLEQKTQRVDQKSAVLAEPLDVNGRLLHPTCNINWWVDARLAVAVLFNLLSPCQRIAGYTVVKVAAVKSSLFTSGSP